MAQQADYVRAETSARVLGLSGGMSSDSWDATRWRDSLTGINVLVCTPQVRSPYRFERTDEWQLFLNLLMRHWKLQDVSLLVFDEAHHATGDHPYAAIIQDYYHRLPTGSRPRVLGLTASPVITSRQAGAAIGRLETVLAARVVSAEALDDRQGRPEERTVVYAPPSIIPLETPFEALLGATPAADQLVSDQLVQQISSVKSVRRSR